VSEEFLYDLWVNAPAEQQRGASVPEIVEADLR
jgi:hypothetical protein